MRIHHLSCGTFCPRSERLVNGHGSLLASGHLSCHCLLIEGAHGLTLVDTGLGVADLANPPGRIGPTWSMLMRPAPDVAESARHQVEALGFDVADVHDIVLTHLDFDHAGGLPDFPNAAVHVFEPEYQAARHPATPLERFRYKAQHWAHHPAWVTYNPDGERWFGFERVRAMHDADTEILLIPLLGHTRGHCGVAVRTAGGWLLHAGDAYFSHDELLDVAAPPVVAGYERVMQMDADLRAHNQDRLRALFRGHKEVMIVCSHDPDEFAACVHAASRHQRVAASAARNMPALQEKSTSEA